MSLSVSHSQCSVHVQAANAPAPTTSQQSVPMAIKAEQDSVDQVGRLDMEQVDVDSHDILNVCRTLCKSAILASQSEYIL